MAYDTVKKQFSREHLWYCEIAVDGETYRFCEDVTPIPAGLEVDAPSMSKPSIRPAQIDLSGGIGVRASLSLSFKSNQDYVRFGTLADPVKFWPHWRARHRGYEGASIAVFSGYIVNGTFDPVNFSRSDFILDSFSYNESGAIISAKDILKLASNDSSKAPRKSTGQISADITDADTSIILSPAGVGDDEYPISGFGRIGDEVVSFTRLVDVLTIVRGVYNTLASEHNEGDLFQLCLRYNDTKSNILDDLLQTFAGVPSAQIPKTEWDNESAEHFPNLFDALITEPTGVKDLLKELGELGSYLFFDERTNLINFVAIKPPPTTAPVLTSEDNFLKGTTSVVDKPEMRVSTVIVNFGIFDPTKDLDEVSNYRQGHVRFNPVAIARYNGIERYKVINSRWVNNDNRIAAVRLASKIGRRLEDIPRMFIFALDAKDSDVKTGSTIFVNSDLIIDDTTSARFNMPVQILSSGERVSYQYNALEYGYGDALNDDLGSEDPNSKNIQLSGELDQLKDDNGNPRTLRDIWEGVYGATVVDTDLVTFIFDSSCVSGSSSNTNYAVDTGAWPELITTPITLDVRGVIVGKGGDGANVDGAPENGGDAIIMNANMRLTNTGIIGGGGGGGNYAVGFGTGTAKAAGGGGAGFANGLAGNGNEFSPAGVGSFSINAQDSTNTLGGDGGSVQSGGAEPATAEGGDGGDLGQSGDAGTGGAGGLPGIAINSNGNSITYLTAGDIRGNVI